jgi:transcriptional regulator with XRE-family HTH domain
MLGKRLRNLRLLKSLTQAEFAEILGVERTRYNKWEQEASEPSLAMLCKIADYFNVSTDYLLGRTNVYYTPGLKI